MQSSGLPRFVSLLPLTAVLLGGGVAWADDEVPARKRYDPNIELPEDESQGRALILRSCTMCHELAGLAGYKGYWGFPQWKEMVEGMVKNGAVLSPAEQDVVAEYLTRHFGPDTRK